MPTYTFSTRNRGVPILVTFLVLGAGIALLLLGIALLAGIAIVGGVLGTGALLYRTIRGERPAPLRGSPQTSELDPALEVFPEAPLRDDARAIDAPASSVEPNDDRRRLDAE
jgi:hypothetical protein